MKRLTLIILLFLLIAIPSVSADAMMPGQKYIGTCSKISNTQDFPDYIFIAHMQGVMVSEADYFVVEEDRCIPTGYKFNYANIYALKKIRFK